MNPWTDAPMPTQLAEVDGRLLGVAVDGSRAAICSGMHGTPIDGLYDRPSGWPLSTSHIEGLKTIAEWQTATSSRPAQ